MDDDCKMEDLGEECKPRARNVGARGRVAAIRNRKITREIKQESQRNSKLQKELDEARQRGYEASKREQDEAVKRELEKELDDGPVNEFTWNRELEEEFERDFGSTAIKEDGGPSNQFAWNKQVVGGPSNQFAWNKQVDGGPSNEFAWNKQVVGGPSNPFAWNKQVDGGPSNQFAWNKQVVGGPSSEIAWDKQVDGGPWNEFAWNKQIEGGPSSEIAWGKQVEGGPWNEFAWNKQVEGGPSSEIAWGKQVEGGPLNQFGWSKEFEEEFEKEFPSTANKEVDGGPVNEFAWNKELDVEFEFEREFGSSAYNKIDDGPVNESVRNRELPWTNEDKELLEELERTVLWTPNKEADEAVETKFEVDEELEKEFDEAIKKGLDEERQKELDEAREKELAEALDKEFTEELERELDIALANLENERNNMLVEEPNRMEPTVMEPTVMEPNNMEPINKLQKELDETRELATKYWTDSENAKANLEFVTKSWEENAVHLENLKKTEAETQKALTLAQATIAERDKTIIDFEARLKEAHDSIEILTDEVKTNVQKATGAKAEATLAISKRDAVNARNDNLVKDLVGMRKLEENGREEITKLVKMISDQNREVARLRWERAQLAVVEEDSESLHGEIESLQTASTPLAVEDSAFIDDSSEKSENLMPTLEDELAGAEGDLSDDEVEQSGDSETTPVKSTTTKEETLIPNPSQQRPVIREVIRNVGVPGPVQYREIIKPCSHNPAKCWFEVEVNFLILLVYWVSKTLTFFAKLVWKAFYSHVWCKGYTLAHKHATSAYGLYPNPVKIRQAPGRQDGTTLPDLSSFFTPIPDVQETRSVIPPPKMREFPAHLATPIVKYSEPIAIMKTEIHIPGSYPSGIESIPSRNMEGFSSCRAAPLDVQASEAIAKLLPPLSPKDETRQSIPSGPKDFGAPINCGTSQQPIIKVVKTVGRAFTKIFCPDPEQLPPPRNTLAALFFHIVVYLSIYIGCAAYSERKVWLAANEQTRAFLDELLSHPIKSGLTGFFSHTLPESWKRLIYRWVWFLIITPMKIDQRIPG